MHVDALGKLGDHRVEHSARADGVTDSRWNAHVVLEDPPTRHRVADEVEPVHSRPHDPRRNSPTLLSPSWLCFYVRAFEHSVGHHMGRPVDVLEERLDRSGALGEARNQRRPLVGGNDAWNEIDAEGLLASPHPKRQTLPGRYLGDSFGPPLHVGRRHAVEHFEDAAIARVGRTAGDGLVAGAGRIVACPPERFRPFGGDVCRLVDHQLHDIDHSTSLGVAGPLTGGRTAPRQRRMGQVAHGFPVVATLELGA